MFSKKRALGVAAGAAALVLVSAPSFADLTKCAPLIDKEHSAMVAKVVKNFQTCVDAYHKDLAKPPTPALSKAAAACEKALAAVLAPSGLIDKEVTTKLIAGFTKNTCTESDLLALGHLSHGLFGDNWARLQGVAALQSAYEQALMGSHDFVNALLAVGGTGSCASCTKLSVPPCSETGARLTGDPNSNAIVKLGSISLDVALIGTAVLKICDNSTPVLPGIPAGTHYVVGGPAKLLRAAAVGALATACTRSISAEGVIFCGAGPQKVNYVQCTDHLAGTANLAGTDHSGGCTGQTVCVASTVNGTTDPAEPADELVGGGCFKLTSTTGGAGDAFVNLSSQIGLAPPGDNCLNTATYTSLGTPATTALTTGTATSQVLNQDSGDADGPSPSGETLDADPLTGSPFNCANLAFGNTGGGKTVGAFSAINTLQAAPGIFLDSTTTFQLTYE